MVSIELLNEIDDVIITLGITRERREIKIIIDSAIEQVFENSLGVKPAGDSFNRRNQLNKCLDEYENEELAVIEALDEILGEYDSVFTKEYTDTSTELQDFIIGELTIFSDAIKSFNKVN